MREPLITKVNSVQLDCDCDDNIRRRLFFEFIGGNIKKDKTSMAFDYNEKTVMLEFNWDAFTLMTIEEDGDTDG